MNITAEKTADSITWFVVLALIGGAGYEVWQHNWSNLFVVIQALIISLIPYFLYKKWGIHTPNLLRAGIVVFMFATLFLGEVKHFYTTYAWWDAVLHCFASVGLTIIGYIMLTIFFKSSQLKSTPFITSVLALCFALAIAVMWEIYEFTIDLVLKPQPGMQPDNTDTMVDLIVSLFGGLVVCVGGYRYFKFKEKGITASLIMEGEHRNGGQVME